MKLQEFVNETLREIIAGVKEAQAFAKDNGAMVNALPEHATLEEDKYVKIMVAPQAWEAVPIRDIDFDVAVTSTDASETQAGAGVFVAALGLGVKGKSDTLNSWGELKGSGTSWGRVGVTPFQQMAYRK